MWYILCRYNVKIYPINKWSFVSSCIAVTNFLSSEAKETTISVTKSSQPLPEVTLDGPLQGKAFAADSFYITAIAKVGVMSLIGIPVF